jgi:transmembrane sensor
MTPGRQLVISPDRRWTLSSVDVKKETSWTKGRLVFLHDPLSEAVAEVNRYSTKKLTFKDGEIPDRQIVGVFSAGDIDGFVKALELNDIARRVSTTNDEILLVEN